MTREMMYIRQQKAWKPGIVPEIIKWLATTPVATMQIEINCIVWTDEPKDDIVRPLPQYIEPGMVGIEERILKATLARGVWKDNDGKMFHIAFDASELKEETKRILVAVEIQPPTKTFS